MNALRWIALGTTALALAACGQKNETSTDVVSNTVVTESENTGAENTVAPAPAMAPGQAFANTAAASDAFEIASSNLAVTQASSAAVKKFASQMITAHTDSTNKLKSAGASASPPVTPDPTLTAEQQQTLDSLKGASGADFDKAYAAAQVDAHQKTLDGLKDYSANGDVPQLKDFAAQMVPIVTAHLNMAKVLKP